MRKLISILVLLCLVAGVFTAMPLTANAALTTDGEWKLIKNLDDWEEFATSSPNGKYRLEADLDFSEVGYTQVKNFTGTFDGNGHTISGITMVGDGEVAMFNCGGKEKTIKNLILCDSTFDGTNDKNRDDKTEWVGALICDTTADTTIENVYVSTDVTVKGGKYVGGFVGGCGSGSCTLTIKGSVFAGTVALDGQYGGGFVGSGNSTSGKIHNIVIDSCLMIGNVSTKATSSPRTSGFVGYNYQKNDNTLANSITNSVFAGTLKNQYSVFADMGNMTVENCYSTLSGNQWCDDYNDGDRTDESDDANVEIVTINSLIGLNAINVEGFTKRDGDIMVPNGVADFALTFYDEMPKFTVKWMNGDEELASESYELGATPVYSGETPTKPGLGSFVYVFEGWSPAIVPVTGDAVYTAIYKMVENETPESGDTLDADIVITSVEDWMTYMSGKTVTDKIVKVEADLLDFEGLDVKPVKSFSGSFDGQGVTFKNLNIVSDSSTSGEAGLFGCLSGDATFKNFVITDSTFTADQWAGAVSCCGGGNIAAENIYISKTVTIKAGVKDGTTNSYAGGLFGGFAGEVTACVIDGCVFAGTIEAEGRYNGGIVGSMFNCPEIVITDSIVLGKVQADKNYSCGFIGSTKAGSSITLSNCIYAGGAENEAYYNRPFFFFESGEKGTATVTNCYTISAISNDKVYNDVRYTDENSGVTLLNSIGELIGANATVTVEGFVKRDADVMLPEGVAEFAPVWFDSEQTYKVVWKNGANELEVDYYKLGEMPTYDGAAPTRPDSQIFSYKFIGWDPEVAPVTGNAVYSAQFEMIPKVDSGDDEETVTEPETEIESEPETDSDEFGSEELDTDVNTETDVDVEIESDTDGEPESDIESETEPESEIDIEPDSETEAETESAEVEEKSFFGKIFDAIINFFKGIFDGIAKIFGKKD